MAQADDLNDKRVCLFTGASGTLGSEFCRLFSDHYHIAAVCRTRLPTVPSQFSHTVDPLNSDNSGAGDPHQVFVIKSDLFDEREIQRVVELTLARFNRIDILVNAAVHSHWSSAVASNALLESALQQFELNVLVPLKLSVAVARAFWRDRGRENTAAGRNIVNVSSSAGVYVYPNFEQSVYSASKAALNYLTCHLANEFSAFGVRVNALAPNAFPGIVPTRRVAQSIRRFDQEAVSGQILIIDSVGEVLYCPEYDGNG
jgi:NAD(P)-dependent dehydrogenase (short-subunit alcohol dehydrogenase family)